MSKRTIDELGLSDLWFEHYLNVSFFPLFQHRSKDHFIQQRKSEIENCPIALNTTTNTKLNLA